MKIEEYVEKWARGEAMEVIEYIAAAMLAEEQGYPEIAEALRRIALEEAEHGARAILLAGRIKDLRKFLEERLECERKAAVERHEEAKHHDEPWRTVLEYTARDEERHARIVEGLLRRLKV